MRTWMSRHITYLSHFDFFTISLVLIVTLSTYSTEDGLVVGKINPEIKQLIFFAAPYFHNFSTSKQTFILHFLKQKLTFLVLFQLRSDQKLQLISRRNSWFVSKLSDWEKESAFIFQ